MKRELSPNEKLVLYGLIKHPHLVDRELSELLGLKHSTITSIRRRLRKDSYFRTLRVPMIQNIGCKLLVVTYTSFNPIINLAKRVQITGKTIEVFEEIFLSIGEQEKGFSLSFSKDYSTVGKINDIRTQTFGRSGLLENEYPKEVLFPFDISKIYRFFDFSPVLNSFFGLNLEGSNTSRVNVEFDKKTKTSFSDSEKKVYRMLIEYPEKTDGLIAQKINMSRHTVSRVKNMLEEQDCIKKIRMPNLRKLGFEILAFYHIKFNPQNSSNLEKNEVIPLRNKSTIFMASRVFETVLISAYANFEEYKQDKTRIIQFLKKNNWILDNPGIRTYSLNKLVVIKDFVFAPIVNKLLEC